MERCSAAQNSVLQNSSADSQSAGLEAHVATGLERIRGLLRRKSLDGVVLTTPANVAWVTGGLGPRVDRTAASDPVWLVVGEHRFSCVTSVVEYPRLREKLEQLGVDGIERVPWAPAGAYLEAAMSSLPSRSGRLGIDRTGGAWTAEAISVENDLLPMRMVLTDHGKRSLAALGEEAARAAEEAAREWRPGAIDLEIQARLCFELERRGIEPAVVIVGGDERLRSLRHPVAVAAPVTELMMIVVVGVRDGLNVALTRFVSSAIPPRSWTEKMASLGQLQEQVVSAAVPGMSYGYLAETLARGYAEAGHPGEWRNHFQGGPIAYQQREFEIAPGELESPWYDLEVSEGHAVAYNPSLPGGVKVEDTYLVGASGASCVTDTGDWPRLALPGGTLVASALTLV